MAKKISFKTCEKAKAFSMRRKKPMLFPHTRKGNKVTYDGRKTIKRKELLAENVPIFFPPWVQPHHISWSDIGDLFFDFMKAWFVFFLMLGWAGLVVRFLMWIYGG